MVVSDPASGTLPAKPGTHTKKPTLSPRKCQGLSTMPLCGSNQLQYTPTCRAHGTTATSLTIASILGILCRLWGMLIFKWGLLPTNRNGPTSLGASAMSLPTHHSFKLKRKAVSHSMILWNSAGGICRLCENLSKPSSSVEPN